MADESDTMYAFNKADSTALIRIIGGQTVSGSDSSTTPSIGFDTRLGVANSSITARSGTTLGTGTVTMKKISDVGVVSTFDMQKLDTSSSSITVWNPGSAIASGAYVICFRVGNKWIAVGVC
jgi:hypothetical protein